MNDSTGKFLDRFTGKIGYITKRGELLENAPFHSPQPHRHSTLVDLNPMPANRKVTKMLTEHSPCLFLPKVSTKSSLARSTTRSQASLQPLVLSRLGQENRRRERGSDCETRQKFMNVGASLLDSRFREEREKTSTNVGKSSSMEWYVGDRETRDFYNQLTNLQQSKMLAYGNNPRVHL